MGLKQVSERDVLFLVSDRAINPEDVKIMRSVQVQETGWHI